MTRMYLDGSMIPGDASDVHTVSDLVARGDLTASEVVDTWLHKLRRADEMTNCVAARADESAGAHAAALDRSRRAGGTFGGLFGVPFTVKDWIDVAGLPCTGGFLECRDRVPAADATVVSRMRAAGAVVLAKTAVQVDSELFGAVLNPHDPTRSPGGSSSGEAAAVGGGGSMVGLASDSGGSIRLPAAWCGAAALKPSAGRVPTTGHFPRVGDRSDGRTQIGPIGTRVRNLIEVLDVIAGPDDHDPGTAPVPLGAARRVDIADLRLGWNVGETAHLPSAAVRAAVERSVAQLEGLGAGVVGEIPQHLDEAFDVTTRYWKRKANGLAGAEVERHLVDWDRYRKRMLRAHRDVDAVIMPITESIAPPRRPMTGADYVFALPASLTGAPAVVVPVAKDAGMPIAVQIVGRPWQDHTALHIAEILESALLR